MKVKYIQESKTYLISNHGVARNVIFKNSYFQFRLKRQAQKYLSPLCEIVSMGIHRDQFQLIVKMKQRAHFVKHYRDKKKMQNKEFDTVPRSTYIFSQAMANLQSSMAIHFNRKENRTGAVFARRFTKIIIRSESELGFWKRRLEEKIKLHHYHGKWGVDCGKGIVGSSLGVSKRAENGLSEFKFSRVINQLQGRLEKTLNFVSFPEFLSLSPP